MQSAAIMDGKPSKGIIAVSPAATESFENARDGLEMQDGDVIEARHGAHFKSSCVTPCRACCYTLFYYRSHSITTGRSRSSCHPYLLDAVTVHTVLPTAQNLLCYGPTAGACEQGCTSRLEKCACWESFVPEGHKH